MSSSSSSFPSSWRSTNRPQHEYATTTMHNDHVSEPQHRRPPRLFNNRAAAAEEENYHYQSFPIQQPLVLDPSLKQQQHRALSDVGTYHRQDGLVKKLLAAATMSRRTSSEEPLDVATSTAQVHDSAGYFATDAPRAGFLFKLGTNVVEFKRRFFVLQSTTFLYYFLSPNDVEPRGCIDLKNAIVRDVGGLRFELCLSEKQVICLEARSEQVKQEWMESLEKERLEYCKMELSRANQQLNEERERVTQLEQEMEHYRHVESDRDMAVEDAAAWKQKYEQLQQAVRLLTRHVRRAPSCNVLAEKSDGTGEQHEKEINHKNDADVGVQQVEEKENEVSGSGKESTPETNMTPDDKSTPDTANTSHRETSLLDSNHNDDDSVDDVNEQLHEMANDLDSFSSLFNACLQLMENVRLASVEATTAVEDLHGAQDVLFKTQKRMTKAERHLCKLWEENCELRKSVKLVKKEKKILKQEVKSLMAISKEEEEAEREKGERLIHELEEHVMTSIMLHEELMYGKSENLLMNEAATRPDSRALTTALVPTDVTTMAPHAMGNDGSQETEMRDTAANSMPGSLSAGRIVSSLFDTDSESDTDEHDNDDEDSMAPSLVSLVAGGRFDDGIQGDESKAAREQWSVNREVPAAAIVRNNDKFSNELSNDADSEVPVLNAPETLVGQHSSDDSEGEKINPLLQLDDTEDEDSKATAPCTQTEETKPIITDNGTATSRLISPLADVVGTKDGATDGIGDNGRVYHLTFYTRKIGLQFQKVPVPNTSNGLLTEAMTTDLGDRVADSQDKTASDLRRIAAISRLSNDNTNAEDTCPVATPVDAVLVCGLKGFDDSSQTRPKLGARLVAFDGVSVEVGRWTFDSVRKAIQACGRPLTLSFRNDMLTTKQRAILTKAITDVNGPFAPSSRPPPVPYPSDRPVSGSMSSVQSSDSEGRLPIDRIDSRLKQHVSDDDDDRSVSTMASVSIASDRQSNFEARTNPYSFSEAGTSSVVSSAFGPLMANLMSGLSNSEKSESSTPQYLRREVTESLEHVEHHRQFQDSLL